MKNIYYLLRQEYYDQRKRALVLGAVIFLIFFCSRFIQEFAHRFGGYSEFNYQDGIGGYLFAAGFIFTSTCFARSMHSKRGQHAWLMFPVHAHEKLIAKIISYSVIYPLGLILFTLLSSLVTEGVMWLIWKNTVPLFTPFDRMIWEMTGHYAVMSSLFLMGSTYFKNFHFIKTFLSLLAFSVSLGLVMVVLFRIAYASHFDTILMGENFYVDEKIILSYIDGQKWASAGETLGKIIYWGLLAPFFWVVSYFRIREIEAKDAV